MHHHQHQDSDRSRIGREGLNVTRECTYTRLALLLVEFMDRNRKRNPVRATQRHIKQFECVPVLQHVYREPREDSSPQGWGRNDFLGKKRRVESSNEESAGSAARGMRRKDSLVARKEGEEAA